MPESSWLLNEVCVAIEGVDGHAHVIAFAEMARALNAYGYVPVTKEERQRTHQLGNQVLGLMGHITLLERALKPFAEQEISDRWSDETSLDGMYGLGITVGDLRGARRALEELQETRVDP